MLGDVILTVPLQDDVYGQCMNRTSRKRRHDALTRFPWKDKNLNRATPSILGRYTPVNRGQLRIFMFECTNVSVCRVPLCLTARVCRVSNKKKQCPVEPNYQNRTLNTA